LRHRGVAGSPTSLVDANVKEDFSESFSICKISLIIELYSRVLQNPVVNRV
jgi:hypothetical protein